MNSSEIITTLCVLVLFFFLIPVFKREKKNYLTFLPGEIAPCGGRNRTRTCDPIDVNDVLYQLSHATIYVIRFLGLTVRATSTGTHRIGQASVFLSRFSTANDSIAPTIVPVNA